MLSAKATDVRLAPDPRQQPVAEDQVTADVNEQLSELIRDPQHMAEVERLLSGRTRDIRLGRAFRDAYSERTWRHSASVIRSWMSWVVLLDAFMLLVNTLLLPSRAALAAALPGAVIAIAALSVALVWRRPRGPRILAWTLMAGMTAILLCVCLIGLAAGGQLFDRYLHIMLFVAITGIVIFGIPFVQTIAIAMIALALYVAFHLQFDFVDLKTAVSSFFFFASGIGATVLARRTMNILAQKSFLLELRDRHRMTELAVTNQRLEQLSMTDGLTGAANRHFVREKLEALAQRQSQIALLMCDIDDFKALNDHLGHVEGDRCLVEVARIIMSCTRSQSDCVARYGGEEFLVVLPDADEDAALAVAERIRSGVGAAALPNPRSRVQPVVTMSVGVAIGTTGAADNTLEEIHKRADQALYLAKRTGRDRVHLWGQTQKAEVFTAHHPDRVSHLIAIGTMPPGVMVKPFEALFFQTAWKAEYGVEDEYVLFFEPNSATSRRLADASLARIAARC